MFNKRNLKNKEDSVAKKFKHDEKTTNGTQSDDVWGEEFEESAIEEIFSQATQQSQIFAVPQPPAEPSLSTKSAFYSGPSTSTGFKGRNDYGKIVPSQMLAGSVVKKNVELNQGLKFDEFKNNLQSNALNSTFLNRTDSSGKNVVLVSDDEQVEKWKEEKKKLLDDFMTKEGETEFLRQQLHQIQTRAENTKKEQTRLMEEQEKKHRAEINALIKEKSSLQSQLEMQSFQLNKTSEKCKMLESGSVKFAQPQLNMTKGGNKVNFPSWSPKKLKTKDNKGVQSEKMFSVELLRSSLIFYYPLKTISHFVFEPSIKEKSVVDIKIEEKIGKRNLAIIQEEETFRIFENPELSKPKITIVDENNLTTEFFMTDLAHLMTKTSDEINSNHVIPIINKLIATARELLLNSTIVLQNISQALQNDDIRDMNELYLSEFYEMPVPHTKSIHEAKPWYDLERGIETRRAIGVLAQVALVSDYLSDYVSGNVKLKTNRDPFYDLYAKQMISYSNWQKKGCEFEFLNLIIEFVTVVGTIRRSHQFSGLLNAVMTLIINVQTTVGFSKFGLKKVCYIFKEIVNSRPLLACFSTISSMLKEFSNQIDFVEQLCLCPNKSGIYYWKGSLNFTSDACTLEILIMQLENFKLDPITLINITRNLSWFSVISLLNDSIPWLEKTKNSCDCCLNLLKFVVINLCESSKINIDELKKKYTETNMSWRISKYEFASRDNKIAWKDQLCENWKQFEQNYNGNFWETLKTLQYSAISFGIRLLSFLAKRDLDFMIRMTYIEDAFHTFLNNINKRKDFNLKQSDEVALDIVKKTFVLDKNKEESTSRMIKIDSLESEKSDDLIHSKANVIVLYQNFFR